MRLVFTLSLPTVCPEPCNKPPFLAITMPLYLVFKGGWPDLAYGISEVRASLPLLSLTLLPPTLHTFFSSFQDISLYPLPSQMLCFMILLMLCHSLFLSLLLQVPQSRSTIINMFYIWVCIRPCLLLCMFIFWVYLPCMKTTWRLYFWPWLASVSMVSFNCSFVFIPDTESLVPFNLCHLIFSSLALFLTYLIRTCFTIVFPMFLCLGSIEISGCVGL
jgi:hypothetical protein